MHYFEAAIQKDPKFAPAYAGIAYSYCWLGFFGAMAPNQAMPRARQAAEKALSLDDSLAAAHTALAYVNALYDFNWPAAEREFKRAMQLNVGDADAHFGYSIVYLAPLGRMEEAVHEMQAARDLDPLSPIESTYLGWPISSSESGPRPSRNTSTLSIWTRISWKRASTWRILTWINRVQDFFCRARSGQGTSAR